MNHMRYFIVLIPLIFAGCSEDGVDSFDAITESFPFSDLSPAMEVDYWELVYTDEWGDNLTLFEQGALCANASDIAACEQAFDTLRSNTGFAVGCLPSYCARYIRYQRSDDIGLVTTAEDVLTFVGEINTRSDALLLAYAYGYGFDTENIEIGGIKETANGYEVLSSALVSICDPVQIDKFHLSISRSGIIEIISQEVYAINNGCL